VRFRDRTDAGRRLAEPMEKFRGQDLVVLGLPRGGVVVAAEVARALAAPLDVIVVRKLGVPSRPELAMGAVGEGGVLVVDERVVALTGVSPEELAEAARRERLELGDRVRLLRRDRPAIPLSGRTAVLVDDGIATGSTARAAAAVARALGATRIVLAAPVCPRAAVRQLTAAVDQLVCLETAHEFGSVGQFYADFRATRDEDVLALLDGAPWPR
jgi:putative phosphoribosyl transferase